MMIAKAQTKEEKIAMYCQLKKKKLAEMLVEANDVITLLMAQKTNTTSKWVTIPKTSDYIQKTT